MEIRIGQRAVYILRDPRCQSVRYVGLTKYPVQRLYNHLSDARSQNGPTPSARALWIQELLAAGLRPVFEVVEWCPDGGFGPFDRERHWIHHYQALGCPLTNQFGLRPSGERLSREAQQRLRKELEARGVRQYEVAAAMGLGPTLFWQVLHGYRHLPADFEARFREAAISIASERYHRVLDAAQSHATP